MDILFFLVPTGFLVFMIVCCLKVVGLGRQVAAVQEKAVLLQDKNAKLDQLQKAQQSQLETFEKQVTECLEQIKALQAGDQARNQEIEALKAESRKAKEAYQFLIRSQKELELLLQDQQDRAVFVALRRIQDSAVGMN